MASKSIKIYTEKFCRLTKNPYMPAFLSNIFCPKSINIKKVYKCGRKCVKVGT